MKQEIYSIKSFNFHHPHGEGDVLTRLRAAQAAMKKEKLLSKDETLFEILCEAGQHGREKKGLSGPKELANGQ